MQRNEILPTFVLASVEPKATATVWQQLRTLKGITWFAPLTGRFDLVLRLEATEPRQVYELVQKLRAITGIVTTSTYMPFEGFTDGHNVEANDARALVFLGVREPAARVLQALKQIPAIYEAFAVPGEFDILATLHGRSYEDIAAHVQKIAEVSGIRTSETLFAYKPIGA